MFFVSYFLLSVPRDVHVNKTNLKLCGKNIVLRLNKHTEKNSSKRNIYLQAKQQRQLVWPTTAIFLSFSRKSDFISVTHTHTHKEKHGMT